MKKTPIESTWAAFWNVAIMPPPTPRSSAGRLFITLARLGDLKAPMGTDGFVAQLDTKTGDVTLAGIFSNATLPAVAVDATGKQVARPAVQYRIERTDWNYQWYEVDGRWCSHSESWAMSTPQIPISSKPSAMARASM